METTRLETFSDGVFAIAATLLILDVHRAGGSVTHGLVHAERKVVTGISRSFRPGAAMYAIATVSSFISAYVAVVLYGLIAAFYVLESSLFGRD